MKKIIAVLGGFCLILAMLIGSVGLVVFSHSFYMNLYDQTNLAEEEGISRQDLDDSIFMMLDYVEGKRDDLSGTITWKERVQSTFNEKEISHMKDVRALWQYAKTAGWIFLLIAVLCVMYFVIRTPQTWISWICWGFMMGTAGFAVVLTFLGCWMLIDFTGFWIQFHHLFFSNNLWLLNPATDFMIVICPEIMFSGLISRILLVFVPEVLILLLGSVYYLKRKAPLGFMNL